MCAREGAARSVGTGASSTSIAGGFKPLPENWTPRALNLALDIEDPFQRDYTPRREIHYSSNPGSAPGRTLTPSGGLL